MSARDALLDAYGSILLENGQRATTLSAVAARAGVSKGGLLYHFTSKDALTEGLIDRLEELMAEDVAAMRAAPDGPSRYYVRTSVWTDCALDRTLVAVAQLAQESHTGAQESMDRARRHWLELIREEVTEEATAHAILLIGDGLYFDAALSGDRGAVREDAITAAELLPVVDRLLEGARGAPRTAHHIKS